MEEALLGVARLPCLLRVSQAAWGPFPEASLLSKLQLLCTYSSDARLDIAKSFFGKVSFGNLKQQIALTNA